MVAVVPRPVRNTPCFQTEAGALVERARYSAYGIPTAFPTVDTDFDGDWDATDSADIGSNYTPGSAYAVRRDADLDGDVDAADVTHANSITGGYQTLGRDVLTSAAVRNRIGYAGYQYDPTFTGVDRHLFHVRHRVYDADLGRWTRRDPLGYVDGMSLYEYVRSMPFMASDPMGLASFARTGCESFSMSTGCASFGASSSCTPPIPFDPWQWIPKPSLPPQYIPRPFEATQPVNIWPTNIQSPCPGNGGWPIGGSHYCTVTTTWGSWYFRWVGKWRKIDTECVGPCSAAEECLDTITSAACTVLWMCPDGVPRKAVDTTLEISRYTICTPMSGGTFRRVFRAGFLAVKCQCCGLWSFWNANVCVDVPSPPLAPAG